MNYTVGDFLIRVKNAYMASRTDLTVPHAKTVKAVADILKRENYIKDIKEIEVDGKKVLEIKLDYSNREPSMLDVKIISKPSLRIYVRKNEVKTLLRELGTHVLSTNQGVLTANDAVKKGVGGELICHVV